MAGLRRAKSMAIQMKAAGRMIYADMGESQIYNYNMYTHNQ